MKFLGVCRLDFRINGYEMSGMFEESNYETDLIILVRKKSSEQVINHQFR